MKVSSDDKNRTTSTGGVGDNDFSNSPLNFTYLRNHFYILPVDND